MQVKEEEYRKKQSTLRDVFVNNLSWWLLLLMKKIFIDCPQLPSEAEITMTDQ